MKKILALAALLIVCIGGYFGYQQHQSNELIKAATPAVKEASIRTQQVVELITNPSNATYAEAFKKAEETIQKINDLIISLESQNRDANPDAIAAATEYLKASQTLTRSVNGIIRTKFESSNVRDRADDALEDMKSTNEYTRKYGRERVDKAIKNLQELLEETIEKAKEGRDAANKLIEKRTTAAKYFADESLVSINLVNELIDNLSDDKDAK